MEDVWVDSPQTFFWP